MEDLRETAGSAAAGDARATASATAPEQVPRQLDVPDVPRVSAEPARPSAADAAAGRPAASPGPPAELGRSVIHALDPGGRLDPGLELRDLAGEAPLPRLRMGASKYRILGVLGEGAMGKVYLAHDRDLGRRVAIKTLRSTGSRYARLFLSEAQVIAQLQHPHIVPVYEVGLSGKVPYYAMPVVRGRTLSEVLERLQNQDETLAHEFSLVRRMQIFTQIGQAVSYAHDRGVVHRDLKPGNVMLGAHGEVQVMDWGLARVLPPKPARADRGRLGRRSGRRTGVVGTPLYMAPEQARGEDVEEPADIWALGAILYEMLCLRRAFDGSATELMAAVQTVEPVPPRRLAAGVPAELEAVCLRALRKERADRQQSAADLVAAVQRWLESEADRAKRHERAEEKASEGRRKLAEYHRLRVELAGLEVAAKEAESSVEGWRPADEKWEVIAAADRARACRRRLTESSTQVVGILTKALGFEDDNAAARELLADYYWDRFREAESREDGAEREYFGNLVAEYHDGKYARELGGVGSLALTTDPAGAEAWLYEQVERGFVLQTGPGRRLGTTPVAPCDLAMGSYLVVLRKEGYRDVRYPVHITRNRSWRGAVRMYTDAEIGQGMLLVPGGPFLQGGDPECQGWDLPRAELHLRDFSIAEHPVTMDEYLEFLNHIARTESRAAAERRAPRSAADAPSYLIAEGACGLTLPAVDAEGDRWCGRMPVIGISWHDAVAYCAWRSERDHRAYRLPDDAEWEKAARGVDGRWFPWGFRFDPSLCNVRASRRERPMLAAVDEFPHDLSPYGVRGLAGNSRDWTAAVVRDGREGRMMSGGAWNLHPVASRCAYHARLDPTNVRDNLGLRLASVPRRDGED